MLKSRIDNRYAKQGCERVCQGDIIRDVEVRRITEPGNIELLKFPYIIVLTQDCDLEEFADHKDAPPETPQEMHQYLPSVLVTPAFVAEMARDGGHLKEIFNVVQKRITSKPWGEVKKNKNERYHFLHGFQEFQIPDLLIDFKAYFAIPYESLLSFYGAGYLATVNELFREHLSQRFSYFLSRIGLPPLSNNKEDTLGENQN